MHLQETNIRTLELLEKFKYLTNSLGKSYEE